MRPVLSFVKALWQRPLTRVVTSLLILSLLFIKLPLSELWQTLRQISPGLWIFAVVVFVAGHAVGAFKWSLLINIGSGKTPFSAAVRYYFAGLFANLFLPSIAGGDVVRAGMVIRYNHTVKEAVILGSLLDRFLDMLALALLILAGVTFSPIALAAEDHRVLLAIFFFLTLGALGTSLLLIAPLPAFLPKSFKAIILRFRDIFKHLVQTPWRALVGLSLAVFIQGVFVLLNAFLGAAVDIHLPLSVWFLVWPLAKLSATLPISIGGLGVREAALAVFMGRFGVPLASSVGLGLLWQTVLVAGGGLGGVFYFLSGRGASDREAFTAVGVQFNENVQR